MDVLLVTFAGTSANQIGNGLTIVLGCAVPLVVSWYVSAFGGSAARQRLHGMAGIFAAPLLLGLVYSMIDKIVKLAAG